MPAILKPDLLENFERATYKGKKKIDISFREEIKVSRVSQWSIK